MNEFRMSVCVVCPCVCLRRLTIIFQALRNTNTRHTDTTMNNWTKREKQEMHLSIISVHTVAAAVHRYSCAAHGRQRCLPILRLWPIDEKITYTTSFRCLNDAMCVRCVLWYFCPFKNDYLHCDWRLCATTQNVILLFPELRFIPFGLVFVRPPVVCADTKYTFHSSFRFVLFIAVNFRSTW